MATLYTEEGGRETPLHRVMRVEGKEVVRTTDKIRVCK